MPGNGSATRSGRWLVRREVARGQLSGDRLVVRRHVWPLRGRKLFRDGIGVGDLELAHEQQFPNGVVALEYRPRR